MTVKEMEYMENFIHESFADGRVSRELRLSIGEIAYLKKIYPKAILKEISEEICNDGKLWVEVSLDKVI